MPESILRARSAITRLRFLMKNRGYDAWIAPTGDPHLSEYLPEHWAFRRYLSNFSGSAGTLVITNCEVLLWTDSRYWEQASVQTRGLGVTIMHSGDALTPDPEIWLSEHLDAGSCIGIDPRTISADQFSRWDASLILKHITLTQDMTLIDTVWTERPEANRAAIWLFDHYQTPRQEKLAALRNKLAELSLQATVISSLEDIAWLTNCRGNDIECTPVFTAYAYVDQTRARLYVQKNLLSEDVTAALESAGWRIKPYESIQKLFKKIPAETQLLLDSRHTSAWIAALTRDAGLHTEDKINPTLLLKSIKTDEELNAIRAIMIDDGIALCELFAGIEHDRSLGVSLTENDVCERLHKLHQKSSTFIEESFGTIAAVGENAALPHYQPRPGEGAYLTYHSVLLVDSGAHYHGGTTDITRTVSIGIPLSDTIRDFTAVLKGHIAVARARFPENTFSSQLDTLARTPVWEIGADYGHGTGHGVGFALSVHEWPVSVSPRAPADKNNRIQPGQVFSNEPGLYRHELWGIRCENLVTPVHSDRQTPSVAGDEPMLELETLSLCPFDSRLINASALTASEKQWLNAYHEKVRNALSGKLSELAENWLQKHTAPIV